MDKEVLRKCLDEFTLSMTLYCDNGEILGLIYTGDLNFSNFVGNWSDLDLFVVLKEMDTLLASEIISVSRGLGKKYNIHIGLSFLTEEEYLTKNPDANSLKDFLMKLGFKTKRAKILVGDIPEIIPDLPNKMPQMIRDIDYFKALLRNAVRDLDGSELLRRCIKCTHYILLCALLMEVPHKVETAEIQDLAKGVFSDFKPGFDIYEHIKELKKGFDKISDYPGESVRLSAYLEEFLKYLYQRAKYV